MKDIVDYRKTILPPGKTRNPDSVLSDTGFFDPNPQSGLDLSTGKQKKAEVVENNNDSVFDFEPYKDYPGPNPKSGVDLNKKKN